VYHARLGRPAESSLNLSGVTYTTLGYGALVLLLMVYAIFATTLYLLPPRVA
jgi:hypothetical protein